MKFCKDCGTEQPKEYFCKNSVSLDGLGCVCRACRQRQYAEKYSRLKEERSMQSDIFRKAARRICTKCKKEKSDNDFYKSSNSPDGLAYQCSLCASTKSRKYQQSEKGKAAAKEYRQSEKGKAAARKGAHNRRTHEHNTTADPVDTAALYTLCNNACVYCREIEDLSIDHVVAVSAGGAYCDGNLLIACRKCNSRKGAKPVAEWLAAEKNTWVTMQHINWLCDEARRSKQPSTEAWPIYYSSGVIQALWDTY